MRFTTLPFVLPALLSVACSHKEPPAVRGSGPGNPIILISIDTLRADHLGCYGYARPTSPNLDQFAREAVLFEQLVNTGGGTLPIHISMLTSLSPTVHDSWSHNRKALPEARITLAEQLSGADYRTAAFVDGGWLHSRFGFAQGFEVYDDAGGRFANILPKVYGWLEQNFRQQFFLFVHTYDVHSERKQLPYDAPEPYNRLFFPDYAGPFNGCRGKRCASELFVWLDRRLASGRLDPRRVFSKQGLEYIVALYDGGIAYVDHQLGLFFSILRALGIYDQCLIIVTSDHGEEFLEHGRLLHHQNYEEYARVPLLIKLPGAGPRGLRIPALVSTLDLMPTILDLAGIEPNPEIQGRSLVPLLVGQSIEARPVLVGGGKEKLRTPEWSMLVDGNGPVELYRVDQDPLEARNLMTGRAQAARSLHRTFLRIREDELQIKALFADQEESLSPPPLPPNAAEELKALGYIN